MPRLEPAEIVRRLAYIRYLHHLGVEQARLPEPMSSASVLMFHDAVESFLLTAGEHLGAPSTYEFDRYWDALRPAKLLGGIDLPVQQGMKRLNHQRKLVKHHGAHPSPTTIELIKNDTATFLAAASQLVFGVDYETTSMASVIPQERVRELVVQADTANGIGDRIGAMVLLTDAWTELFSLQEWRDDVDGSPPFKFGPTLGRTLSEQDIASYLLNEGQRYRYVRRNEDIGRQIAGVTEIVKELQAAARLTSVGIDFAAYHRFRALTPQRDDYYDGRRKYHAPPGYEPTADDVASCLQFVVTAALRFAAAQAQLTQPPWGVDAGDAWRTPWELVREVAGDSDGST
ncbi:hypothetical protein [Micromonospora sp. NPDC005979]|uniref:hypothetical protein n=1 Tax=Micromonospora sp. NPDC005979 TaxID=3156726 RepID=UPI0033AB43DC